MNLRQTYKIGVTATLLALPLVLGATGASAQTLEIARVRLPSGQVITIDDGHNWYQDQRVVTYKRYYYEPRERVYVVYNDDNDYGHRGHDMHHRDKDDKRGHFCPPGQAKKGRC
jgi:hypothetical protein